MRRVHARRYKLALLLQPSLLKTSSPVSLPSFRGSLSSSFTSSSSFFLLSFSWPALSYHFLVREFRPCSLPGLFRRSAAVAPSQTQGPSLRRDQTMADADPTAADWVEENIKEVMRRANLMQKHIFGAHCWKNDSCDCPYCNDLYTALMTKSSGIIGKPKMSKYLNDTEVGWNRVIELQQHYTYHLP